MSIKVGGQVKQFLKNPSQVTIPISRPQMVYTSQIIMTQANSSMGWPLLIPLNCERQRIRLVVNITMGGLVARPYQSTLKYLN